MNNKKEFVTGIMKEIECFGDVPYKEDYYKSGVESGVTDLFESRELFETRDAWQHANVIIGHIEFKVVIPSSHMVELRERIWAALDTIYRKEVTT